MGDKKSFHRLTTNAYVNRTYDSIDGSMTPVLKPLWSAIVLQPPRPATGVSRALRARSVPRVSRECPSGCLWGPSGPGLRSVQIVSRECPQSVKKVSRTLRGHSRDTFWTLRSPKGPRDTPRDTPGTLSGHFGPEGPERLL